MKIKDLYINPKNVCTIVPFIDLMNYGLEINGTKINFGSYSGSMIEEEKVQEIKDIQQKIINEVDKHV